MHHLVRTLEGRGLRVCGRRMSTLRFRTTHASKESALLRTGCVFGDVATPCYEPAAVAANMPHLTPHDNCKKLPDLTSLAVNVADM